MLPWLALPYTAAHLGFEAQKTAFRLLGLGGGLIKTTTNEIFPEAILPRADTAPASVAVAPKTRHAAKKITKSRRRFVSAASGLNEVKALPSSLTPWSA